MFILSWYAGRSCCSLSELNRLFTLGGQQTYLLMPAQRSNPYQLLFMCIPSHKAEKAATYFVSLKYSAFMQLSRVRWCGVFGAEQCWGILWTPIEDFGCITSHAQSTAATYFTGAVKSDVVHLIVTRLSGCNCLSDTEMAGSA